MQGRLSEGSHEPSLILLPDLFFLIPLSAIQEGGDLASVHSMAENDFLEDFVKARPVMDSRGGER